MTFNLRGSNRKSVHDKLRSIMIAANQVFVEQVLMNLTLWVCGRWGLAVGASILLGSAAGPNPKTGEALTLYNSATVKGDRSNFIEALADIEASIKIIENLRTKITNSELRTSYFATVQNYYQFYVFRMGIYTLP